jgi:hypothetical protein
MATPAEAYPLYWPDGWKRISIAEHSRFKTGFSAARIHLSSEIQRMGGSSVIISTNVPLRNDGMPRANMPEPRDAGVAVYFKYKKKDMVFACDKYHYTRENIYAIAKTIVALRGIERWGASDMMERAFTGFSAFPTKASSPWREVLNVSENASMDQVDTSFRALAKEHHPDVGGDENTFRTIIQAREDARKELGVAL